MLQCAGGKFIGRELLGCDLNSLSIWNNTILKLETISNVSNSPILVNKIWHVNIYISLCIQNLNNKVYEWGLRELFSRAQLYVL